MNTQSTLKGYTSPTTSTNNEVYGTKAIPTFRAKPVNQEVEVNIKTLNEPASADALRVADPFTYYSCFTPADTLSSKLAGLVPPATTKASENGSSQTQSQTQAVTVKVARKGRVTTECEGLQLLLRDLEARQGSSNSQGHSAQNVGSLLDLYSAVIGMDTENDVHDEEEQDISSDTLQKQ